MSHLLKSRLIVAIPAPSALTAKLIAGGGNSNGQLGDGTTTQRTTPVAVKPGAIPTNVTLTQITAGASHTCALGSNSKAYCWGRNDSHQLGYGNTADQTTPVPVALGYPPGYGFDTTLIQISAGDHHTCALGTSSKAYCWGYNGWGELGDGNTHNERFFPAPVSQGAIPTNTTLTQISSSSDILQAHTCALGSNNRVYCWGYNGDGRLGDGTTTDRTTPVAVNDTILPKRSQVTFDTTPATSVRYISPSVLKVTVPAHSAGQVSVTVANPGGASKTLSNAYTYYTVPSKPSAPNATPGNGQVTLSWSAPNNGGSAITGYIIQYKLSSNSSWTTFSNNSSTATSITVTGLTNGSAYNFRVAAKNAAGTGAYSNSTTSIPRTTPSKPATPNADPGNTQVALSWSAPNNGGSAITGYIIQYRTSPSGTWTTFSDNNNTTTSITVTGLTNGTTYDFRVAAKNIAGTGTYSDAVTSTPRTVPAKPAKPTANANAVAQIYLSWTAPTNNGGSVITGYDIRYRVSGGNWTTVSQGTTTNRTFSSLANGTTYEFQVAAKNVAGNSAWSDSATATTWNVPNAPTISTITPGNTQVTLNWSAPANNGSAITDYIIEYKTNAAGTWSVFNDGQTPTTGATVTGLTNGTLYNFRVKAKNAVGDSAYSATVNSTPRTVPAAPSAPNATPGNGQVALSWSAPTNNGGSAITGYDVQYRTGGGAWTTINNITTTNRTVTGLTNGTSYEFQVRAKNAAGNGAWSASTNSTVWNVPGIPTSLTATPGIDSVVLSWTAPGNGGTPITDYKVEYCESNSSGTCLGNWTIYNDGTSTNTTATVSGLSSSETTYYSFRVSATNTVGTGSPSTSVTAQASYVTVSTSSNTVSFNITPATANRFNSATHNITVKTNNPLGYDLRLSTNTTHSNLTHTTKPTHIISPTSAVATSPQLDLPVNTWGYRINNDTFGNTTTLETNTPTSQYTWAKVQPNNTPDTILTSNNPTISAGTTIPVYYGIKVSSIQAAGIYQATVVYTAVVK